MNVTSAEHRADRAACMAEVERIVNSHSLRGSEALCKMLRYLTEQSFAHPSAHPKEYQIATEVFGRPADFDPQSDSTTRVQAGRLRSKLAEYYASEGADDLVVVEMPKGSYLLSFHTREAAATLPQPPAVPIIEVGTQSASLRPWRVTVAILSALLVVAIASIIWSLLAIRDAKRANAAVIETPVPKAFRVFWKEFVSGPSEPWVVFSNADFIGRPDTGMRYFDASRDSRDLILDHYSGVGEVLAVHELDRVFTLLHQPLRVKRGSLLSLDDAKNNNLIFVGSPVENLSLLDLPGTREFQFRKLASGPRARDIAIINLHPHTGEPAVFLPSLARPLSEDYAVIALMKGPSPALSMMILAGTTTLGTQAAVEYVCRENSVQELLNRLQVGTSGDLRPFEMVLRVKVTRGVPVDSEIAALR
jgi:hypothetical protein